MTAKPARLAESSRPLPPAVLIGLAVLLLRAWQIGNPQVTIDEQFYLLVGARMHEGAWPYVDIFDRKPVGLFLVYALAASFGDGVLAYQLLALASVATTALLLHRMALRITDGRGALLAALAYPAWLALAGGSGGQSPVFYNLPMAAAALLALRAVCEPQRPLARPAMLAMAACGIAMQIKYNAAIEGVFLGLVLAGLAWRRLGVRRAIALAAAMVAVAAAPTAAAWAVHAIAGAGDAWLFANFSSILARAPLPPDSAMRNLGKLAAILLPLLLPGLAGMVAAWRTGRADALAPSRLFVAGWTATALAAVIAFGTWFDHYALPVMLPGALSLALLPPAARWLRGGSALTVLAAAIAGQVEMVEERRETGGIAGTRALVAAMRAAGAGAAAGSCPLVYDGPTIAYHLGGFCLPSRLVFPSHFNLVTEAGATGAGAADGLAAVLARRPPAILVKQPGFALENPRSRAMVDALVAREYALVARWPQGERHLALYRHLPRARRAARASEGPIPGARP